MVTLIMLSVSAVSASNSDNITVHDMDGDIAENNNFY